MSTMAILKIIPKISIFCSPMAPNRKIIQKRRKNISIEGCDMKVK